MHTKLLAFALILLLQACRPLSAQTLSPAENDSPGILQRLAERARQAKSTVSAFGETALGFLGAYYEDHIQPVTDSYVGWASDVRSSMWEKIQTTMDNYMPFKATNATDQNPIKK
ncbi:apolipoprotein C-IV [Trachinotus anak]|uniref:apolipoprotein C-IV n=1 Tax=Trachinotus anak TaxID=443729 RepID=UPI0039F22B84